MEFKSKLRLTDILVATASVCFGLLCLVIVTFALYIILNQGAYINSPSQYKLVIDHDGGADDAMAIFMAVLYEKYFNGPKVIALTTTHGNVNESQAFINSQRILDKAGRRDIPIFRGATKALVTSIETDYYFGVDGLGDLHDVQYESIPAEYQTAAFALIELSKKYQDELIVMAIGPQTNPALAKRLDPEFESRLKQLYVGAGHVYSALHPLPEFNAGMDVEAYYIVVDGARPDKVTNVPFSQVYDSINISREWRTDVLGGMPTEIMKAQNDYERISIQTSKKWSLLDPIVAAIVLDDIIVTEYKYSNQSIILCGDQRGINTNNFEEPPNVRIVNRIKQDSYQQLLLDIFSAELFHC